MDKKKMEKKSTTYMSFLQAPIERENTAMPQNVLYDRGNRGNTIAKILKGLGAPYMREIKEAEGSIYVC